MSAFDDEVLSINAIYGDDTLCPNADYSVLRVPNAQVALRLTFPTDYPEIPPEIIGPESAGSTLAKGEAHSFVDEARSCLTDSFRAGEPCIFDLVESISGVMQAQQALRDARNAADAEAEITGLEASDHAPSDDFPAGFVEPAWSLSEVITEKKSVFMARAVSVSSPEYAKENVRFLIATDKKAARATHNMTAWRIRQQPSSGVVYQDCDDDGETAAGGRLLHLLELMDLWNVMVVVTRWYGGTHLGPDRFRIINSVARDALIKAGFTSQQQDVKARQKHR